MAGALNGELVATSSGVPQHASRAKISFITLGLLYIYPRLHAETSKMAAFRVLAVFLFCTQASLANVEKTIFLGPKFVNVPLRHPTLEDLHIDILTPKDSALRTKIEAEFPDDEYERGKTSWFLLDDLKENQRYEVRICWAATVRTGFPSLILRVALTLSLATHGIYVEDA